MNTGNSQNELGQPGEEATSPGRRQIVAGMGLLGAAFAALSGKAWAQTPMMGGQNNAAMAPAAAPAHQDSAEVRAVKIARAMRAGPSQITQNATVAEMDRHGITAILREGNNGWICTPGNENRIGDPPMCMDENGMKWFQDVFAGRPRPTNTVPGLCYMLCGATQHSNTDTHDHTSPAIPIGPHWMVLWPFDAQHCGLPTDVRDDGAWIMFANTPYAYLHICGSPWVGNSYNPGDEAVWTMRYEKAKVTQ